MEPTNLLVAQWLSLSGLVGATGAYAGMVRRRAEHRLEMEAAERSSHVAVERVDRQVTLGRLEHTFIRSAYPHRGRGSTTPRR